MQIAGGRVTGIGAVLCALCMATGCKGGGDSDGDADAQVDDDLVATGDITLSARLFEDGSATPLTGYQLSCVSLGMPLASDDGIADGAGLATITFTARDVPIWCYVLDAAGDGVAPIRFSDGLITARTATFSGDADLGQIDVDPAGGSPAESTVPASGTVGHSSDYNLPCPLGSWTGDVWPVPGECMSSANSNAKVWVSRLGNGNYQVAFRLDEECFEPSHFVAVPASYDADVLTFTLPAAPFEFSLKPDATCGAGTLETTQEGCAACDEVNCSQGGTLTCTNGPYSVQH